MQGFRSLEPLDRPIRPACLLPSREQPPSQSTLLLLPLHNFPFKAEAKPLKQRAIVQTHHCLPRLCIDCDPAPLRPRILHDFNFTHRNIPVIGWVADKNNTQTQLKRNPTLFFPFQNKPCGATGNN
jgi:hypothetical protein